MSSKRSQEGSSLHETWQTLYAQTLPDLAKSRASTQPHWPVVLDHCFARIILDRVVGEGQGPWTQRIKAPAIRNMSDEQMKKCIELGQAIAKGRVNLVELDEESLRGRGKKSKHFKAGESSKPNKDSDGNSKGTKRKRAAVVEEDGKTGSRAKNGGKRQLRGSEDDIPASASDSQEDVEESRIPAADQHSTSEPESQSMEDEEIVASKDSEATDNGSLPSSKPWHNATAQKLRHLIKTEPTLNAHRKSILLALMQVPRGHFTTYGAMSDFLRSSPRAVGNGMRNNPFAPDVPCHRVLAADGKIGGYCGQWGEGNLIDKKRRILREEGVRFDGKGKVVGSAWRGFK